MLKPEDTIAEFEAYARAPGPVRLAPPPAAAAHMVALLKHAHDRISALEALCGPEPHPEPAAPEPALESVCAEADRIVAGDRQSDYGNPRDNWSVIASLWEPVLGLPPGSISPETVGLAMIQVKIARQLHKPKRDNLVDVCGYAKAVDLCRQG